MARVLRAGDARDARDPRDSGVEAEAAGRAGPPCAAQRPDEPPADCAAPEVSRPWPAELEAERSSLAAGRAALETRERLLEAEAEAETRRLRAEVEAEVVPLALEVARAVLSGAALHPQAALESAGKALAALRGAARLRVHPADGEAVARAVGARVAVVADPEVGRGGAVAEGPEGSADARLEAQVAELARALGEEP